VDDFPEGAFSRSIATTSWPGLRLADVADPALFVITADGGASTEGLGLGTISYPDICALECSGLCGWADWEECTWAADCGLYTFAPAGGSFVRHVSLRLPYTRHRACFASSVPGWARSGVNVGFLDGHVEWIPSETVIGRIRNGVLAGVTNWVPTSEDHPEECFPGGVTLY
jgi:prepilin-type processing-associated H-X9-DG protein